MLPKWLRSLRPRSRKPLRSSTFVRPRGYGLMLERLEDRWVPSTFTVTNTNDDGNAGSFRWAILLANNNPGADTINFNIPGGGVQTINVVSTALPNVTGQTIIDATTQPGYAGSPLVVLNGANAGGSTTALTLTAGSSTVKGLDINQFGGDGIDLVGSNNTIQANFIGTNAAGTAPVANGGYAINIISCSGNQIGGASSISHGTGLLSGAGNLLSGNEEGGILVENGSNNVIQGNYLSTDVTGLHILANGMGNIFSGDGIDLQDGATDTIVGGVSTPDAFGNLSGLGNLISGGGGDGIFIAEITAANDPVSNSTIQGNYIGVDVTGAHALGNSYVGIHIEGLTTGTQIGGTNAGTGNVISSNGTAGQLNYQQGIKIQSPSRFGLVTGTVIQGNFIGTDFNGTHPLGNLGDGVQIIGDSNFALNNPLIGGSSLGSGNVISGNLGSGVEINNAGVSGTKIEGNYIGTTSAQTSAVTDGLASTEGNSALGVGHGGSFRYQQEVAASDFTAPVLINSISFRLDGAATAPVSGSYADFIAQLSTTSQPAGALSTTFANNVGADVKTVFNGPLSFAFTAAGPGNGPNAFSFTLTFTTPFLYNPAAGNLLLEYQSSSGPTVSYSEDAQGLPGTWAISASAPNATTATQSFAGIIVTKFTSTPANLGNGGNGVLITGGSTSNTIGGTTAAARNLISGNFGNGIELESDSNLVEGNFIGTDVTGTAALGQGYVNGANTFLSGVMIFGSNNTIGGMTTTPGTGAGNVISGNSQRGITTTGSNNLFEGNLVGTNAAGMGALADGFTGVEIDYGSGNTLGGTVAGAGNVISGNGGAVLISFGATQTLVAGNLIGTDITGSVALPNFNSVQIIGASNSTIGGTTATAHNVISGNAAGGIVIEDANNFYGYTGAATGNVVEGNFIGTNAAGTGAVANSSVGIYVSASSNTIGGTSAAARNVISGNGSDGVDIIGYAAPITNLAAVNQLISGALPRTTANGTVAQADYSDQTSPSNGDWGYNNPIPGTGGSDYGFVSTGTLQVNTAGTFTFDSGSDDGSELLIDGSPVVVADQLEGFQENFGTVTLTQGAHSLEWIGFQHGGAAGFELSVAVGSGITGPISVANGWHVLGDPSPAPQINLQGTLATTVYYSTLFTSSDVVEGNFIGTNAAGTAALTNVGDGIYLSGSSGSTIGGTAAGAGNVISGNGRPAPYYTDGIVVAGVGTSQNLIAGNLIGTDVTGTVALGNGYDGIAIVSGASANTVGGTSAAARNVIAANSNSGVEFYISGSGNLVEGNFIGTDVTGSHALGIQSQGIVAGTNSSGNTFGGTMPGAGNVISGSTYDGILVYSSDSPNNLIAGNYIGTNATGTGAVANGADGIQVASASNTIGGTTAGAGNLIGFNGGQGVLVNGPSTADLIQNNIYLSNTGNAVELDPGSQAFVNGTIAGNVLDNGTFDLDGLNASIGALSGSGVVTSSVSGPVTFSVGSTNSGAIFAGVIQNGAGSLTLTKTGTGVQTLRGLSTYTGITTISAGTLRVGDGNASASLGTGAVIDNASLVFQVSNNTTFANNISGTGTLTQQGVGTITLTGTNTYHGATTITAGAMLEAGSATAFSVNSSFSNAGILNLGGFGNSIGALNGNGTVTNSRLNVYQIDDGSLTNSTNTIFGFNNSITANAEDNWIGNVFVASEGATQLSSVSFAVFQALNSTNLPSPFVTVALYTGSPNTGLTLVQSSVNRVPLNAVADQMVTVPFAQPQNLPSGQVFTAAVLIDDVPVNVFPFVETSIGTNTNSYYDLSNPPGSVNVYNLMAPNSPTLNGLSFPGSNAGPPNGVSTTLLRVNASAASGTPAATFPVSGGGSFTGAIQDGVGAVALNKTGANTLKLSGANTYSGGTTVTAGTLIVTGGLGTGLVSIASGATLDDEVIIANDMVLGSLRQALLNANLASGPGVNEITFAIPGSGVQDLLVASALPAITSSVLLDGTTQPGYAGTPLIELDGSFAQVNAVGLTLDASNITVEGLDVVHFGGDGIDVTASQDRVQNNYIGVDPTGSLSEPNGGSGIHIFAGASNNDIIANVISANSGAGIDISGVGTSANTVQGNYIGTNAGGSNAGAIPGAVAWLKGEGNTQDSTGNHIVTQTVGVTFAPGEVGQAFSLNGTTGFLELGPAADLTPLHGVSVEAWIDPTALPAATGNTNWWDVFNEFFDAGSGLNGAGAYALRLLSNGAMQFLVGTSDQSQGTYWTVTTAPGLVTPGTFTHVAGTYDSTTGKLSVYVNGVATTITAAGTLNQDEHALKIGADLFNSRYFNGLIDEPTVYGRALGAAEIARIYALANQGKPVSLGNGIGVLIENGRKSQLDRRRIRWKRHLR